MTFEESINRLEEILKQLEGDKVDLMTALSQYEEGVHLLKNCHQILETARQKIEILRNIDSDGSPIVEPFGENENIVPSPLGGRARVGAER